MHRSHGLQGSLKRRYKHPSPTSINGYHAAKKLLSQWPAKRPTFAFAGESGYTLAFANRIAHSGLHAETGAVSDGGAITTLGAFCAVRKPCVARCQNGVLCRFGILAGRCSRRTQKAFGAAMRLCASLFRRRRGPAGLRDLFRFCRSCGLYTLRSELSVRARQGWYHYPRRALRVLETPDGRLSKGLICRFLRLPSSTPCAVTFSANMQISLSVISVANVFALWYDKSHKSGSFGDEGEPE